MTSAKARTTAQRYYGAKAADYDKNREGQRKWEGEAAAVERFLRALPAGTSVLDIPCGTGRFFDLYASLGLYPVAMDVSTDMLAQAQGKANVPADCRHGDIFDISLPDNSVDVAISIRFMNLIERDDLLIALRELQRVARKRIAFTLRVGDKRDGHYHSPRSIDDVRAALSEGWRIEEDQRVHEDTYRLVILCAG